MRPLLASSVMICFTMPSSSAVSMLPSRLRSKAASWRRYGATAAQLILAARSLRGEQQQQDQHQLPPRTTGAFRAADDMRTEDGRRRWCLG